LATVVATAGSTYQKPGARMLIYADGSYLGLLSGGCLEADLQLHAQEVIEHARTRAVEYDMRGPDDVLFGIGAGCEGAMRVLIEPAGDGGVAAEALEAAGRILSTGEPTCLVAVHDATELPLGTFSLSMLPPFLADAAREALAARASRELDLEHGSARVRAFAQFLAPPPHLLVCGAGPDARPVVSAARAMGWRVTVVDHRPAYADARQFPGAQVVLVDARALLEAVDVGRCQAAVVMSTTWRRTSSTCAPSPARVSRATSGCSGLPRDAGASPRSSDRLLENCAHDCGVLSASTSARSSPRPSLSPSSPRCTLGWPADSRSINATAVTADRASVDLLSR
jgi:xanthine/CO dehydrogenase XdhC/CoxF family maturation factor